MEQASSKGYNTTSNVKGRKKKMTYREEDDAELIPIIKWEMRTFTHPVIGLLVFTTVALLPVILFLSLPSMWVAGITFGFGYGLLLTYPAIAIAAGGGTWFHQFRAVTLIRISPFPYVIYNYCAVATGVQYGPYMAGSLLGMVPDNFVAIYTGTLIRKLADASTEEEKGMSVLQIVLNILGFVATVLTTVLIMKYAKRQLEAMRKEEEALLLQ
ncbi:hypothetical protein HID58_033852 [Brassica napus]|uniref:Uncharacterized protein n=1 Tax=Brassica napus TaxID=3708 RepID=A0ABQ8C0E8_BRANA|nr:hypothetical protein HID58_033852 [Brassica napus]